MPLVTCPAAPDSSVICMHSGILAMQHEAVLNDLMSGSSLSDHLLIRRRSVRIPRGIKHASFQC